MIILKSELEIKKMRQGGKILAQIMNALTKVVTVGITTKYIDEVANKLIKSYGTYPSFLNYNGFPASICTSINEEVVHGIPSNRVLCEGDILSIDIGIKFDGLHTDMAVTIPLGNIEKKYNDLIGVTKSALDEGIKKCIPNNRIGDIGFAVEQLVKKRGFSVVREYVGHGIGRNLHEDPAVPNFGKPGTGEKLLPGMTIAIEPMVNIGTWETKVKEDNWTVVTKDGKRSAHFEHTVLITENEPEILTLM